MALLLSLASVLGIEADVLIDRLKKNALAWSAIALFALIALAFLLVTAYNWLADWLGPIWGPLAIAGAALFVALAIYITVRVSDGIVARRQAKRRQSSETTALVTTAAITALPMLLKSPLLRTIGIPVGGALAAYFLLKANRQKPDSD